MTDTITDFDLDTIVDLDDPPPEDCAHIVARQGQLGAGALIVAAAEAGMEVVALCGWKWIPKGHAPENLPVCKPCAEIWAEMADGQ